MTRSTLKNNVSWPLLMLRETRPKALEGCSSPWHMVALRSGHFLWNPCEYTEKDETERCRALSVSPGPGSSTNSNQDEERKKLALSCPDAATGEACSNEQDLEKFSLCVPSSLRLCILGTHHLPHTQMLPAFEEARGMNNIDSKACK